MFLLFSLIFSEVHFSVFLFIVLGVFIRGFFLFPVVNIFSISASFSNSRDILLCNVQWKAIMLENIRDGFVISGAVKSRFILKSSANEAEVMIWQLNKPQPDLPAFPAKLPKERETQVVSGIIFSLKGCGGSGKPVFGFACKAVFVGNFFFPAFIEFKMVVGNWKGKTNCSVNS